MDLGLSTVFDFELGRLLVRHSVFYRMPVKALGTRYRTYSAMMRHHLFFFFHFGFATCEAKTPATTITPRIEQPELQKV